MKNRSTCVLTCAAALTGSVLTVPALADEVTLIEGYLGYEGVRDNTIFSEDGNVSNGSGDHVFAGNTGFGGARRALVRFDLTTAGIPSNATVTRVELSLTCSRTRSSPYIMAVHRLLADWGEGTEDALGNEGGGTQATTGTATWTANFWQVSNWANAGGDFVAAASAATTVQNVNQITTWSGAGLVADVQDFLDNPASNFGWIFIGDEARDYTAFRFYSSDNDEGASIQRLPRLFIEYTVGGGAPTLTVDGTCPGGGGISISWTDATPNSQVGILYANTTGTFTIPENNPCPGTVLGLSGNGLQLVFQGGSGANGSRTITGTAPSGACNHYMQLVDGATCTTSNVAQIQ